MIDNIMNMLFPMVSGEISVTDTPTRESPNSNESDFAQVLSILMTQMGLTTMPLPQDGNSPVLETEVRSEEQTENVPSVITNSISTELSSNVASEIAEEIVQLPDSGVGLDSTVEQGNTQIKNPTFVEIDVKEDVTIPSEIQNKLLLQIETDLEQKIAKVNSEAPLVEQANTVIKNSVQLNPSQKESSSIDSQKVVIPADIVQTVNVEIVELPQIQDKLHIKNVELSSVTNPEQQSKIGLLKLGQISNGKDIQSDTVETQSNTQQKYVDILTDIKHYLSDNTNIESRENILSKVLETRLISNSGEQNNSNPQHKSDLPNSNSQLGIPLEKYLKIGNEGVPDKTISATPAEPKEVVATLSSLRSIITEQIRFAVRSETKTITIRLEPESLGMMEVKVQEHSGKVGIQLTTSSNEVHKVLTQGLPQLREVLKQEGILVKDVQVVSTGTASLMLNQDFNSHSFSKDVQIEPTLYHLNRSSQQTVEETKPISDYHNGTLSLWV